MRNVGNAFRHAALKKLRAALPENGEYSPIAIFGLTPRQVYARYGTPTTTYFGGDGSVHWMYATEDGRRQLAKSLGARDQRTAG